MPPKQKKLNAERSLNSRTKNGKYASFEGYKNKQSA